MSKNKKKSKFLQLGLTSLLILSNTLIYNVSNPLESHAIGISTENISFGYSTERTKSKTITIPNMRNVKSITSTNNGQVSYEQKGETLKITVSNGSGKDFQTGGTYIPADQMEVSGQYSSYYNNQGYSGYLTEYLYSGSYISASSKYVNGQSYQYYNDGEYSGTLEEYVYSGSLSPGDSKFVTQGEGSYTYGYHCTGGHIGIKRKAEEMPSNRSDIWYNQGGYSGWLRWSEVQGIHPDPVLPSCNKEPIPVNNQIRYKYDYKWSGTVTKSPVDTRVWRYRGTVYRPASDTRDYRYRGTVYRPASDTRTWETRYAYDLTIEYSDMPLAPSIITKGKDNVWQNMSDEVVIVDNENPELTDFRIEYLQDNGDWVTYEKPIPIEDARIYEFKARVVTEDGLISPITQKTIKIDKIPPVINATVSNTNWTNQTLDIFVQVTDDASGVKRIQLPNGNWVNGDTTHYSAPTNGKYTFYAEDNAGNISRKDVDITNIDKTNPDVTLTVEPSTWTNQDANIRIVTTDSQTGVKRIQLPNGNWISVSESLYQIPLSDTYSFKVEDNVGNMTTKSITVTNIDKVKPTAPNLSISNANWTSGTVSFSIDGSTDTQSGVKKYQYKLNDGKWIDYSGGVTIKDEGIYKIICRAQDVATNYSDEVTKTLYLDNSDAELTFTDNANGWTNKPIKLTATATDKYSGVKEIIMPTGEVIRGNQASIDVSTNGTFTFGVEDNVGHVKTEVYEVKNIDTTLPTMSLKVVPPDWTNQDAQINAIGYDNESGVDKIQLPNGNWVNGANANYSVGQNGTYQFAVQDRAGNTKTESLKVTNIDKTKPTTPSLTASTDTWGLDDVTMSISGSIDNESGLSHYEYKVNNDEWKVYSGAFKVNVGGESTVKARAVDIAGNTSSEITKKIYVDNVNPVLEVTPNTTVWTNQDVTLTATASDVASGLKHIKLPNDVLSTTSPTTFKVSENGSYSFMAEDVVGNKTTKIHTVSNIDKVLPSMEVVSSYTHWTNQPVLLRASASDNESKIKGIYPPSNTLVEGENATHSASINGTYTFKALDNAGNIFTKSITVSNIDLTPPTKPTITYNNNWTKDAFVDLTAIPGTDTQSGVEGIEYKLEGATTSGWQSYEKAIRVSNEGITNVIFHTVDNAGNISEDVIASVKIDRSSPYNNAITIHLKGTYKP